MANTQQLRRTSSETPHPITSSSKTKPQWLLWALGSGAFAATNGVFAKLTTADSTQHLSAHLGGSVFVEYALRAIFFGLNLLSNAVMWILFTRALTAATSTTRVSILNTSANFLVTAVYGLVIFGEGLSWQWIAGAALLVAGSVVIGRREGAESGMENGEVREGAIRLDGDEASSNKPANGGESQPEIDNGQESRSRESYPDQVGEDVRRKSEDGA